MAVSPRLLRRAAPGSFIVLCAALSGCGASKGDVTGKVKFKDQTLPYGSVQFQTSTGQSFASEIAEDGSYSIKGVPAGSVKVAIACVDPAMEKYLRDMATKSRTPEALKTGGKPIEIDEAKYKKIPGKYSDFNTSGLSYDVVGGQQTKDFDLK
jgi:hypothetical protein